MNPCLLLLMGDLKDLVGALKLPPFDRCSRKPWMVFFQEARIKGSFALLMVRERGGCVPAPSL